MEGKVWFSRKLSVVTLGITAAAVEELGEVTRVELPDTELDFDKGEVIATVDCENGSIEVEAPAAGLVVEINETAKNEPGIISEDPFEEGWLVKIEIQDKTDLKEYAKGIEAD
ncbi:MAG: hypothetical protein A2583_04795 [Bdellovibrionales bacterium RIFOXYD1_FULL_53_11]|nr:MAG: hypothetical protein A2583_04795 [Bdellovibrionales bacterium RIFOXYD1_FULL_53_11]